MTVTGPSSEPWPESTASASAAVSESTTPAAGRRRGMPRRPARRVGREHGRPDREGRAAGRGVDAGGQPRGEQVDGGGVGRHDVQGDPPGGQAVEGAAGDQPGCRDALPERQPGTDPAAHGIRDGGQRAGLHGVAGHVVDPQVGSASTAPAGTSRAATSTGVTGSGGGRSSSTTSSTAAAASDADSSRRSTRRRQRARRPGPVRPGSGRDGRDMPTTLGAVGTASGRVSSRVWTTPRASRGLWTTTRSLTSPTTSPRSPTTSPTSLDDFSRSRSEPTVGRRAGGHRGAGTRVGAVEATALEDDADRVEDLAQAPLALGAHGERVVAERLHGLETVVALGARVGVRRHDGPPAETVWCADPGHARAT